MLYYELIDPSQQLTGQDFHIVRSFSNGRTQIGWHYIIDLTWIYSRVKHWPKSINILDAGGGTGPLQFFLAELGFNITNVDMNLKLPPPSVSDRYQTALRQTSVSNPTEYMDFLNCKQQSRNFFWLQRSVKKFKRHVEKHRLFISLYHFRHNRWRQRFGFSSAKVGKIKWAAENLCNLNGFPSKSFDAVVSLSALEHIPMKQLRNALNEIRRVLKNKNFWAITTAATDQKATWYHQPSEGYCYSVLDLEKYFEVTSNHPQNPKRILQEYKNCDYLERHLAKFYSKSGGYGMPWGIWDPKYIPVGIYR